jgi:hypothetical protein
VCSVSEYTANSAGSVCAAEGGGGQRKGSDPNCNWFQKGDEVGWSYSPQGALETGKPTGYEKNIDYTRRQASQQAGVAGHQVVPSCCGRLPVGCAVFQFPVGARLPANVEVEGLAAWGVKQYSFFV